MRHIVWMAMFAGLTGVVFGAVARGTDRQRLLYGLKVFGEFMFIALALGWILYFLPYR